MNQSSLYTAPAESADEYASQLHNVSTDILNEIAPFRTKTRTKPKKPQVWLSMKHKRPSVSDGDWSVPGNHLVVRPIAFHIVHSPGYHTNLSRIRSENTTGSRSVKQITVRVNSGNKSKNFCIHRHLRCKRLPSRTQKLSWNSSGRKSSRFGTIWGWHVDFNFRVDPLQSDLPHTGELWQKSSEVTVEEVRKVISSLPSKTSPLDVFPTSILKSCVDVFSPIIATLAN